MENHLRDIINDISGFSVQPEFRSKEYLAWVKQASFIKFIQKSNSRSHIILYASAPHLYMYSVLIANTNLNNFKSEDLEDWDFRPGSSWGITYTMGDSPKIWISAPMESSRPNIFEGGEQLIFSRRFDGRRENKDYFEMSQRLAHSFGLHWVPENNAFCRLDEGGEIEEIVKVTDFKIPDESEEISIVTIKREVLDEYLVMTNQILVSMYDSTRFDIKNFTSWEGTKLTDHSRKPNIYFKFGKHGATESYLRGFQLILPKLTLKEVYESHNLGSRKNKKYATFIIQDWKNKKVREWSCDPKKNG